MGRIRPTLLPHRQFRDASLACRSEHDLPFDASLMKSGENILRLTVPGGGLMNGIIYYYLRLELNENVPVK
jgi:hypothetical protein